jgi:hypothetical protein
MPAIDGTGQHREPGIGQVGQWPAVVPLITNALGKPPAGKGMLLFLYSLAIIITCQD